ncbi:acyl CoA:acetate/3-ketoacid CoA transferase [Sinanaerobacter chloroacetimidivorans]|uniref:Acyl CoA:acetate/3-ketoacid CoA transferase n=1 Tax=Sinanaerobacter chloroacetimidivorans TaxID=2818044 RepID=A0A8J7W3A5_9FIRM|nr:acyl CoA:acetate/3-ketoacid CoA transferase [Sinanaerobacter chloroacetimidivorans]MBR0600092.1 acyl CoA:acetate/3-ketoacid CoA transferase [Sinanaerobacter chloroacetimidivorans]
MSKVSIITAEQAANLVEDGDTVITSGFVGNCNPEELSKAIEQRFLQTGSPRDLTYFYSASQGDRSGTTGGDHFAHEGLVKRVIVGHYATAPKLGALCLANKCEAYNLPQGVLTYLIRDIAGHRPGTITHVGLDTFVDPRNGGGKVNSRTTEDLVELLEMDGEEKLFYKAFPLNVAFLRGTYADEYGNVTLEKEAATTEVTSIAQAVKNNGGKVVVQVEKIVRTGTLDPRLVKIPGIYVHAVVVSDPKNHEQSLGGVFNPAICGMTREPVGGEVEISPLSAKKIIGRRAAMELRKDTVVNLGIGTPEYVAQVTNEEGIADYMTLTVESGVIGGVPQSGAKFGSSLNPDAIIDQPYQFDFYDGGGLDMAFLGLAECDEMGNINVSKFGPKLPGCGGFINITQNAKNVYFCGTFNADGLKAKIEEGRLVILEEGKKTKFIKQVEQVTFSGRYANKKGQKVLYITERCVFELRQDGLYIIEVAPGIDVRTQIIELMEFEPKIDLNIKSMDEVLFREERMGLNRDN